MPSGIVFDVANTEEQFNQILRLQQENLVNLISEEQQARHGFVFAEHTLALLKRMATYLPQVVALSDNKVVGYNLALHVSMKNEVPKLIPMFHEFEQSKYKDRPLVTYKFMVGGQVCVDKNFRGQGLMSKLYHETKNRLPSGYELCVTEVAARNIISLKAHEKMGFEVVNTYNDGKELWNVVVWNLDNPTNPQ
ncbi:MAG TPA: GNAT family N-acetyltransferase [Blastocatellia bacterium]|nr:GNAT family N-acetyltransferase [Blastocatellia bacterium]